jgi:hypothetical protein
MSESTPNREPDFEPPFTVKLDGKVVQEGTRNRWDPQHVVDHLRRQHPGSPDRVQAFHRWDRRCDGRPLDKL